MSAAKKVSFNLSIGSSDAYDHILLKTGILAITTDNMQSVKRVLRQNSRTSDLPGCIIFNLDDHAGMFTLFMEYMRANSALSKIPLFVYKKALDKAEKDRLATIGGIDGVLTAASTFETFNSTYLFAQKIKQLSAAEEARSTGEFLKRAWRGTGRVAKRAFDISVSGSLLLALSPVLLAIAAAVRFESKGPVFYVAPRAGKRYQIFKFYKFRTMVADADKRVKDLAHLNQYDKDDKNGAVFFKLSNDPRVTKIGAFLRNTSLDELPQLINVLKGDMSLVGNRPLPLYEAATLTTDRYAERFIAPAGITGLWQVKKRGKKEMSVDERIGLDIDYAKKHSFFYDMRILVNTPAALIQKDNV